MCQGVGNQPMRQKAATLVFSASRRDFCQPTIDGAIRKNHHYEHEFYYSPNGPQFSSPCMKVPHETVTGASELKFAADDTGASLEPVTLRGSKPPTVLPVCLWCKFRSWADTAHPSRSRLGDRFCLEGAKLFFRSVLLTKRLTSRSLPVPEQALAWQEFTC